MDKNSAWLRNTPRSTANYSLTLGVTDTFVVLSRTNQAQTHKSRTSKASKIYCNQHSSWLSICPQPSYSCMLIIIRQKDIQLRGAVFEEIYLTSSSSARPLAPPPPQKKGKKEIKITAFCYNVNSSMRIHNWQSSVQEDAEPR